MKRSQDAASEVPSAARSSSPPDCLSDAETTSTTIRPSALTITWLGSIHIESTGAWTHCNAPVAPDNFITNGPCFALTTVPGPGSRS
ncbi:MAG TPA: hypothetical protein VIF57_20375, partial [Polyangia bacterium]